MAKPSTITQWMQHPAKFTDEDRKTAASLLKAYPYFVPARLMEAAEQQKKTPFAPQMMAAMQLYMGNWLLFHTFMQAANSAKTAATVAPALPEEAAAPEIVAEDPEPEEHSYESQMDIEEMDDPLADEDDDFEPTDFESDLDFENFNDRDADEELSLEQSDDQGLDFDFNIPEPTIETITKTLDLETPPAREKEQPPVTPPPPVQTKTIEIPVPPQPVPAAQPDAAEASEKPPVPEAKQPEPVKEDKPKGEKQTVSPNKTTIPPQPNKREDSLIQPIYTEDYFLHQGIQISDKVGGDPALKDDGSGKSLMIVMSFAEWLNFFKTKNEKDKEEQEDQRALKTMWQKEKLAAALEEENDEIPENVFEMAVNSITQEEGLASESLAEILVKQGKHDKAIEMYRKLSLRNPHKNAYFARRIDEIIKGK